MSTGQRRQRARKKAKKTSAKAAAACGCGVVVTLPDHLVAEVLLRLPARSLSRLRCTCRSWNAEISSRVFQERHHALAAAKPPKLGFLKPARPHSCTWQVRKKGWRRPGSTYLGRCVDCPSVIGIGSNAKACCGLVLVGRRCAGYYVCNPTTSDVLRLPRSRQLLLHCAVGLGFHAPSREFKVVQIRCEDDGLLHLQQQGEVPATVLTVGDARGWRAVAAARAGGGNNQQAASLVAPADIDSHVQPVLADGCLHWSFSLSVTAAAPHGHGGIISFSLADESFRLVTQPPFSAADLMCGDDDEDDQLRRRRVGKTTLAELDGSLCVMRDLRRHRSDDVGSSLLFEIWKLQDYDTGSWSLDYRVDLTPAAAEADRLKAPCLVVPLRYLDVGGASAGSSPADKRKLLLATTAQEAHIYDPGSGTLQTVASCAAVGVGGSNSGNNDDEELKSVRLVLYQESLVRFPGMKKGKARIRFLQLEQL